MVVLLFFIRLRTPEQKIVSPEMLDAVRKGWSITNHPLDVVC